MKIFKRRFEARLYPKGSLAREKMNMDILTSEHMPDHKYAVTDDSQTYTFRTKKEARALIKKKKSGIAILIMIVVLFITIKCFATQVIDTTATVVCGTSEQPTPCVLVLNRSVPSYMLTIKKDSREICTFKVDRVEGAWKVLGETRKENLIEVIVDTKDGSCVVVNPRLPNIGKDIVPDGSDGLIIKTVEVKTP